MSRSARLLGHLARTGDPIHDLPQTQALHYVREVLVNSGVLAARNEHLERLAPSSASYVTRTSSDGHSAAWETPVPWFFPGQSPARPAVDILFGVRLHRYGIDAHAGRDTARLGLAAELPASVLADLTGISISTAERWSQWAK